MNATTALPAAGNHRLLAASLFGLLIASVGPAQNLVPNPMFEAGGHAPEAWTCNGGGRWITTAEATNRAVEVEGTGDDQSHWQVTPHPALVPGGVYALQFRGRRDTGTIGGTAVSGTEQVNRDFPLTDVWQDYGFVFRQPDDAGAAFLRLGQWHARGRLQFDEVGLHPVLVAHRRTASGLELGEGESVRSGVYRFRAAYGWRGASLHRPLVRQTAGFNSDRLLFSGNTEVIYRLAVPGATQQTARVRIVLNHHETGILSVEAGTDGSRWTSLGRLDADRRSATLELPPSLLPSTQLFVRLAAGPGAALQVNALEYEARLEQPPPDGEGETHFLEVHQQGPELGGGLEALRYLEDRGLWEVTLTLTNQTARTLDLRGSVSTERATPMRVARLSLPAKQTRRLTLQARAEDPGPMSMFVLLRGAGTTPLFVGRTTVHLGWLSDRRPGYWLSQTSDLGLWWSESGWKIGRDRGLPSRPRSATPGPVRLAAAGGEFEAVQVVLRPGRDGRLLGAHVEPFHGPADPDSPLTARVDEVAHVRVVQPTDGTSAPGWYPDPLPPLRPPLELIAGRNQSLWITVHVPAGTAPGLHRARLALETSLGTNTVPLEVTVFGFDLPPETHLRSALGLGAGAIHQFHHLDRPADRQAVFEKYLRNFAEHRLSPYSFFDHAPIDVRFEEVDGQKRARMDFQQFDAAAGRWLGPGGFTSFRLPLVGMGGGTFHSRHQGELAGFKEGTAEYARLFNDYLGRVESHLRDHGWLSRAYTYWFDEPDPKDYEFVIDGMKRLKTAAPSLRRLLTEQPEPVLFGHVDIWCALTPEWTPENVKARRDAGEEVWWYICTVPKAPYVTEFIDHAATELRLWPWQSWQYGVQGILIWATIYWHSPTAYPGQLQDPWQDPMSWVSGYGFQPGQRSPWGNGDGRFLYPPRRDPNRASEPCLDEPVNSIRWENLRDGMEDYEYLWLLQDRLRKAEADGRSSPALLDQARSLLIVPDIVSKDLTRFTTDPRPILEHRQRVAEMIVRLSP